MWSREAVAAPSVARAWPTDAVNSSADSSATTSPARTRVPFWTLMTASWPPTSGAARISVARTTPTTDAVCPGGHRRYPPAPAAARRRPSTIIRGCRGLAIRVPPFDQTCGNDCEHEVADGEEPKASPGVRHVPKICAQLANADDAVDREIGRKDMPGGEHRPGDRFARPGEAGQEELGQTGGEEDQHRRVRARKPAAHRLAHEARRENEERREYEQLQRVAERREAVEARQHDQVERERGQVNGEVRDAAAQHARERS